MLSLDLELYFWFGKLVRAVTLPFGSATSFKHLVPYLALPLLLAPVREPEHDYIPPAMPPSPQLCNNDSKLPQVLNFPIHQQPLQDDSDSDGQWNEQHLQLHASLCDQAHHFANGPRLMCCSQ